MGNCRKSPREFQWFLYPKTKIQDSSDGFCNPKPIFKIQDSKPVLIKDSTNQPTKMEDITCEYKDCGEKKVAKDIETALKLMEMHERAIHQVKKEEKKEEKE